jgi:hypothetical protein
MESERNRPERYGPRQTLDPGSPAAEVAAQMAARVQAGLDPIEVGRKVLTAIREDELYVFTHPEMSAAVETRFTAILDAMGKANKHGEGRSR